MEKDFKPGDIAYLIESNRFIREGKIGRTSGSLYLFCFIEGGATQVKKHRLFASEEAAQEELDRINGRDSEHVDGRPETPKERKKGYLPYDVGA